MTAFVESCVETVAGSAHAAERRARHRPRAAKLMQLLADKKNILVTTHIHPDPDALASVLNGNPYDNPSVFHGHIVQPSDKPRFQGRFSLVAPIDADDPQAGSVPFRYGVRIPTTSVLSRTRSG